MKKKINIFINNNSELLLLVLGLSVLLGIGYYDDSIDVMMKLIFYIIIFGVIVGLISFIIKIFFK